MRSRAGLGFPPFDDEREAIADFKYLDHEGVLTQVLFGPKTRGEWSGRYPTYYLEVKASSGPVEEPFHISASQLSAVRSSWAKRLSCRIVSYLTKYLLGGIHVLHISWNA